MTRNPPVKTPVGAVTDAENGVEEDIRVWLRRSRTRGTKGIAMLTKKSFTRAAAASVAGLVVVLGSTGPVQADPGQSGSHGHSGHSETRAAGSTGRAHAAGHQRRAHDDAAAASRGRQSGRSSSQGSTPRRHTPVTVCHLLGNGSYHLLTFDRRALDAHQGHGDLYPVPAGGCPGPAASEPAASGRTEPERSQAPAAPQHQRVTVCHLLGNGTYHVLSFDRHALRAHLAHGDLYPVPADGCAAPATAAPESAGRPADESGAGTTAGSVVPLAARPAVVAGVELELAPAAVTRGRTRPGAAVLGAEALAAGRNASSSAPSATGGTQADSGVTGVLPQTGAAPVAGALLAGFGLLTAGAVLLRRRARSTV